MATTETKYPPCYLCGATTKSEIATRCKHAGANHCHAQGKPKPNLWHLLAVLVCSLLATSIVALALWRILGAIGFYESNLGRFTL